MEQRIKAIDVLRTALGTMVVFPIEESDMENIGKKIQKGSVQRPIFEGANRRLIEDKLIQLLSKLE